MIRIIDKSICERCTRLSCSFLRTFQTRTDLFRLSMETTVCPTQVLSDGPDEEALKDGVISKKCISCGLCIKNCAFANLELAKDITYFDTDGFSNLTEPQLNAIVSQYLAILFDFAANSNRNRTLLFDGIFISSDEEVCFVEIDWHNDSLESARRLLGDILLYRPKSPVFNGLIVLEQYPYDGNRDVYNLLRQTKDYPKTSNINIHITTIQALKVFALSLPKSQHSIEDLFFNPLSETLEEYKQRIFDKYSINL